MRAGWFCNPRCAVIKKRERFDNSLTHSAFGVEIYRIAVFPCGIDFSFKLGQIHFYLLRVRR
jgi:hypothetical protein